MHPRAILPFVPYLVVSVIHLVELAFASTFGHWTWMSKSLLMPALLVGFLVSVRYRFDRVVVLAGIAIVFSWAGDVLFASPSDNGFVFGLGGFLLGHIAYAVLFLRLLRSRPRPLAWALVGVWFIGLLVTLLPHLGVLAPAVILYGVALALMTAGGSGVSRLVGTGAVLFLSSDTVLSLTLFLPGFTFPHHDEAVMVLYLAGQLLIVLGLVRNRALRAPGAPGAPGPLSAPRAGAQETA